jgi:hypothetical protein
MGGHQDMRAIIRFSMTGDTGSVIANPAEKRLFDGGFSRIGTRSLEATGQDQARLFTSIREFLRLLESGEGRGRVNHLWVYVDDSD